MEHVLQAEKGADLDFPVGRSGADVARDPHYWIFARAALTKGSGLISFRFDSFRAPTPSESPQSL